MCIYYVRMSTSVFLRILEVDYNHCRESHVITVLLAVQKKILLISRDFTYRRLLNLSNICQKYFPGTNFVCRLKQEPLYLKDCWMSHNHAGRKSLAGVAPESNWTNSSHVNNDKSEGIHPGFDNHDMQQQKSTTAPVAPDKRFDVL